MKDVEGSVWSTTPEFVRMECEYPLKTWGRMAGLVVGDIRCRMLERHPVGLDVYCFCLWISGKERECLHRLCLVQGWMFRVVIDSRNTAALELWSGQDGATICLLVDMLQTSALKITSSFKKYRIQILNIAVSKCLWYYSSAVMQMSSRHKIIFSCRISFSCV